MSVQDFPSIPEDQSGIYFISEEIDFIFVYEEDIREWLKKVIEQMDCELRLLNFIFCSDEYLHQINIDYLKHDTFTDVITFPYTANPLIEGDIFISIDRIIENAEIYKVPFQQELFRVMVHGVIHLCGYGDKTKEEKIIMKEKENEALHLLDEMRIK